MSSKTRIHLNVQKLFVIAFLGMILSLKACVGAISSLTTGEKTAEMKNTSEKPSPQIVK